MPPLLCLPPVLIDHSFPRNDHELRIAAVALGEIGKEIELEQAHLLPMQIYDDLFAGDSVYWGEKRSNNGYGLLRDIQRFLSLLSSHITRNKELLEAIDISNVQSYLPHPVPQGFDDAEEMAQLWSEELGKIMALHDNCIGKNKNKFFVGVVSAKAFADEKDDVAENYINPDNRRVFPLVGLGYKQKLVDAYEWDVPTGIRDKQIYIRDIERNYRIIGASLLESPKRDDHFKLIFVGQRPWTFNKTEPVPDPFLRELVEITSYPLEVIKAAFANGELPQKTLKFNRAKKS